MKRPIYISYEDAENVVLLYFREYMEGLNPTFTRAEYERLPYHSLSDYYRSAEDAMIRRQYFADDGTVKVFEWPWREPAAFRPSGEALVPA